MALLKRSLVPCYVKLPQHMLDLLRGQFLIDQILVDYCVNFVVELAGSSAELG